jgi:hypothetical protein
MSAGSKACQQVVKHVSKPHVPFRNSKSLRCSGRGGPWTAHTSMFVPSYCFILSSYYYVSSYIGVLILLFMCPHTAIHVVQVHVVERGMRRDD